MAILFNSDRNINNNNTNNDNSNDNSDGNNGNNINSNKANRRVIFDDNMSISNPNDVEIASLKGMI